MAHGDITRMEWKVTIERPNGFGRYVEWAQTEQRVSELRARYNVVSVEWAEHVLDF